MPSRRTSISLSDKIDGVLNAAIQSHAADRIVDMRGVAGKQNASFAKGSRDTLVRHIEVAVNDLVWPIVGKERLHAVLNAPHRS